MNDLYLIAHKVRGEPAFDIATQVDCPECHTQGCNECDNQGWWFVIPTSGHRAYPWWHANLADIDDTYELSFEPTQLEGPGPMPEGLPDHYTTRAQPTLSLADALGLRAAPKPPSTPILRRF